MKSFDLNLKVETTGNNYCIIELSGFLDAHTVNSFENRLEEILQEGEVRLVIDLQGLSYISSAGIGALMALTQHLRRKDGDLVLLKPNDKVYKILDLLGFTKIFNVAVKDEEINSFFKALNNSESE
jgi:anti-sigma B factor antagonist